MIIEVEKITKDGTLIGLRLTPENEEDSVELQYVDIVEDSGLVIDVDIDSTVIYTKDWNK